MTQADIVAGVRPGIATRITEMHERYYVAAHGFDLSFVSIVSKGLTEFSARPPSSRNGIWSAMTDERQFGSIAIDGEDLGTGAAHLRWFIVDHDLRGAGVGRRLLKAALSFVDEQGFTETHLWTFGGLDAARHLYESHGFALVQEQIGNQWGKDVLEQKFVRPSPN